MEPYGFSETFLNDNDNNKNKFIKRYTSSLSNPRLQGFSVHQGP